MSTMEFLITHRRINGYIDLNLSYAHSVLQGSLLCILVSTASKLIMEERSASVEALE